MESLQAHAGSLEWKVAWNEAREDRDQRPWRPIRQSEKLVEGRLQGWANSDGSHREPFPGELEGEGVTEGRSWEGQGRGITEGRFPMGQEARGSPRAVSLNSNGAEWHHLRYARTQVA